MRRRSWQNRLAYVDAVEGDAAGIGVVKPEKQAGECGLAAAGPSQQPQHPAGREVELDVAQDGRALIIGEDQVLEGKAGRAVGPGRARPILDVGADFLELTNASETGAGALQLLQLLADADRGGRPTCR